MIGGDFLFSVEADSTVVDALRETGITLGGLYADFKLARPSVETAVKKALGSERDDQELRVITSASLALRIPLHCFTNERFLEVLADYESGEIKKRLEEEFSQVGIKVEGLKVEIENVAEVKETKEAINKRMALHVTTSYPRSLNMFSFKISTDNYVDAAIEQFSTESPLLTLNPAKIPLCALYADYPLARPTVDAAVKKALGGERDDQKVEVTTSGCLFVRLNCSTDERFLEVLGYYESGEIMKRLGEELSNVRVKVEGLKVEIENLAEVNATKEAINKRKEESDAEKTADISPAAKEEGYDVSRFVGEVRQDLLCSICKCVPKDPRLCKNKDHIFCLAHISQHLLKFETCPNCRDPLTADTMRHPTGFLKNSLDDLKIRCDHHDRGCLDELSLEGRQRHVDQCGYAPVVCGNEGCETIVDQRDKQNHEKKFCRFRIPKWHEMKASQDEMKASQDEFKNDARVMKQQFELFIKKFDRVADRQLLNVSSSNEEIIIMGGCGQDGATYDSVSIFNPASETYAKLPPMNIARSGASSCVYNNEVIIAGGSDEKTGLDTIEILKINQDLPRWTISRGKLPCRLSGYALKVYQEKLLVIGGYNWDTKTVSNEIYELALDEPHTATLLATMPEPRRRHTAEIVNGQLFILGGTTTHNENEKENVLASVLMYDFITKQFTTRPPLPKPVCHMSIVTRGNKIIVVGGEDKKKQDLNDVIMYDTETGRSEILPSLNHERRHHSAVICDDVIFALGGFSGKEVLNSVEGWKIDSDENWTERRGMSKKGACVTAVVKPK